MIRLATLEKKHFAIGDLIEKHDFTLLDSLITVSFVHNGIEHQVDADRRVFAEAIRPLANAYVREIEIVRLFHFVCWGERGGFKVPAGLVGMEREYHLAAEAAIFYVTMEVVLAQAKAIQDMGADHFRAKNAA